MSAGAVAERYAQALFELGQETRQLTPLTEKLGDFAHAYESSKELRSALSNPTLTAEQHTSVLSAIAKRIGVPEMGIKGLLVMAARGRLPDLSAVVARLSEMSDEKNGIVRASVTTASKMPESYYQALVTQLEVATKKKIVLERAIDEQLVGGAIARIGDTVIDGSVRGQLDKVEREIIDAVAVGIS